MTTGAPGRRRPAVALNTKQTRAPSRSSTATGGTSQSRHKRGPDRGRYSGSLQTDRGKRQRSATRVSMTMMGGTRQTYRQTEAGWPSLAVMGTRVRIHGEPFRGSPNPSDSQTFNRRSIHHKQRGSRRLKKMPASHQKWKRWVFQSGWVVLDAWNVFWLVWGGGQEVGASD